MKRITAQEHSKQMMSRALERIDMAGDLIIRVPELVPGEEILLRVNAIMSEIANLDFAVRKS